MSQLEQNTTTISSAKTAQDIWRFVVKYSIYFIFLGIVILLTFLTQGRFLTINNILTIARQTSTIGLIAFGVTLIIITHGIDLSSGSVLAFVSVVAASFLQIEKVGGIIIYPKIPIWVANSSIPVWAWVGLVILLGLALGSLLGFSNGGFVVWGNIPPFISTLGMMTIARGFAFIYAGGAPISFLYPEFKILGQGFIANIPNPVFIFLFFAIVTHIILNNTKLGRYIYAIGANPKAAYVSGINTKGYTLFVYVYAGFLAAIAGLLLTARVDSGQAGYGVSFELFAIASAVIGGTSFGGGIGTIPGTFVGALLITVIKNGMDIIGVPATAQLIAIGAIIIIAVIIDQKKNQRKT